MIKYPKQIDSVIRKNKTGIKTLGFDAELFLPSEEENISPLEMHSGFSRIVLSLIDKKNDDNVIVPKANIPAKEIDYIKKKTEIVLEIMMQKKYLPLNQVKQATKKENCELNSSVAYEVKLVDRNFKGKTPAEVLIENPDNAKRLIDIRKWLTDNLKSYPKNQEQINAIDNALDLLDMGKLSLSTIKVANTTNDEIKIYSSGYKFRRKQNDKGHNEVYTLDVICDTAKDYPFAITIMNCFAPVVTDKSGLKNIQMTQATDIKKATILLNEAEWYKAIAYASKIINYFEATNFGVQKKKADDASYHNSQK